MLVILSVDTKSNCAESEEDDLRTSYRRCEWNVVLVDGHSPRLTHNGRSFNTALEATSCARWCKVLALKYVHVVCSKMKLCWCTTAERTDDVIIQDDSHNDNSLFKLASTLMDSDNGSDEQEEKFEQMAQLLIQMLHCYILPIVNFKTKDIPQILNALALQDACLECIDTDIMSQTKRVESARSMLTTYLEAQLAPEINSMCCKNECSKEFLEIIIKDLSKQEMELRQKFDRCQYYVDEAKSAMAFIKSVGNKNQLEKARKKRGTFLKSLQTILQLRENVLETLQSMAALSEGFYHPNPLVQDYMDIRKRFSDEKDELCNLCKFKVCALTVRESLYTLREELTHQGFSQGTGYYCDSCSDVDGGVQSTMDLQTTSEKLAMVLKTNRHLKITDIDFVTKTEKHCQEIVQVLVEGGVPEDQRVITWETVSKAVKSLLKSMKSNVKTHLHKFAPELANAMGIQFDLRGDVEVQIQSIQLTYEEHFFGKLGKCIELIYETINEEIVDQVIECADIVKKMNREVLIKDLQLKDEWWLKWFSAGDVSEQLKDETDGRKKFRMLRGASCPESSDIVYDLSGKENIEEGQDVNIKELYRCNFRSKSQQVVINLGEDVEFIPSYTPVLHNKAISHIKLGKRPRSLSMEALGVATKPRSHSCPEEREAEVNSMTDSVAKILSFLDPSEDEVDSAKLKCIPKNDWLVIERDENAQETPDKKLKEEVDLSEKSPELLKHFGRVVKYIQDMFQEPSPINKLKCLRAALMELTSSVEELRYQKCKDYHKNAVAAEELIPFTILMLRELETNEIALLYTQIAFLEDYMASFLSSGVYCWSLIMFTASHKELVDIGKRNSVHE